MATETFTHRALTAASPGEVWSSLQKADTWAKVGGVDEIRNVRVDDEGNLVSYDFAVTVVGKEYQGTARRTHLNPPRQMVLEIDSGLLEGRIVADVDSEGEGSVVRLTMTMSPKGFMASMLFGVISSSVGNGFDQAVEAFVASIPGASHP